MRFEFHVSSFGLSLLLQLEACHLNTEPET
jgi:hypothetical protein